MSLQKLLSLHKRMQVGVEVPSCKIAWMTEIGSVRYSLKSDLNYSVLNVTLVHIHVPYWSGMVPPWLGMVLH